MNRSIDKYMDILFAIFMTCATVLVIAGTVTLIGKLIYG